MSFNSVDSLVQASASCVASDFLIAIRQGEMFNGGDPAHSQALHDLTLAADRSGAVRTLVRSNPLSRSEMLRRLALPFLTLMDSPDAARMRGVLERVTSIWSDFAVDTVKLSKTLGPGYGHDLINILCIWARIEWAWLEAARFTDEHLASALGHSGRRTNFSPLEPPQNTAKIGLAFKALVGITLHHEENASVLTFAATGAHVTIYHSLEGVTHRRGGH
jgi:hypothetical protein